MCGSGSSSIVGGRGGGDDDDGDGDCLMSVADDLLFVSTK